MSDQAQLPIGPDDTERAVFASLDAGHEYTLERIRATRPTLIPIVRAAFFESGFSLREIAQACTCSVNTIRRILLDCPASVVDTHKKRMADGLRITAHQLLEAIQARADSTDGLDEEKLRDIATTLGILVDKSVVLDGGHTIRLSVDSGPSPVAELLREYGFPGETPGETREGELLPDPPAPALVPALRQAPERGQGAGQR